MRSNSTPGVLNARNLGPIDAPCVWNLCATRRGTYLASLEAQKASRDFPSISFDIIINEWMNGH